jgi:hypothetical protein
MELGHLRSTLIEVRGTHARSIERATKYVKGVLIVGGAFIAGVAQFVTWPTGGTPDPSQVVGIAATVCVLVGGVMVLLTEKDAAAAVEIAQRAVDQAQEAEGRLENLDEFFDTFGRAIETYQMCLTLRGALEQAGIGSVGSTDDLIRSLFELVSRAVTIASAFEQADRWTIGIYKAEPGLEPGKVELKCIAHDRAIKCEVGEARVWPRAWGSQASRTRTLERSSFPISGPRVCRQCSAPEG